MKLREMKKDKLALLIYRKRLIHLTKIQIKLYVKTGVPHGYLLRTFLFLFYFNDLQRVARDSQIEFLADDTNMVKSGNNTDQKVDEEL